MSPTIDALRARSKLERELGRYLTRSELEVVQEKGSSNGLTAQEFRALKRIWPGMQIELKMEVHRVEP